MTIENMRTPPKSVADTHFTREEAAKYLGVTPRTLIRWEQFGEGPPITRLGRRILYKKKSLRNWVGEQEYIYKNEE